MNKCSVRISDVFAKQLPHYYLCVRMAMAFCFDSESRGPRKCCRVNLRLFRKCVYARKEIKRSLHVFVYALNVVCGRMCVGLHGEPGQHLDAGHVKWRCWPGQFAYYVIDSPMDI